MNARDDTELTILFMIDFFKSYFYSAAGAVKSVDYYSNSPPMDRHIIGTFVGRGHDNTDPLYTEELLRLEGLSCNAPNILGGTFTSIEDDKDNIILALQDEVERLRLKLNTAVESAQSVIEEAHIAQVTCSTLH